MVSLKDDAGADFAATALPASSAWRRSELIRVQFLRRVTVRCSYDASTSSGGYPLIQVLVTAQQQEPTTLGEPLETADIWHSPAITDGSITPTAMTGALPASTVWTNGPLVGLQSHLPLVIKPAVATASTSKIREKVSIDVTDDFWMFVIAQELGLAANPGTLKIWVNGS